MEDKHMTRKPQSLGVTIIAAILAIWFAFHAAGIIGALIMAFILITIYYARFL